MSLGWPSCLCVLITNYGSKSLDVSLMCITNEISCISACSKELWTRWAHRILDQANMDPHVNRKSHTISLGISVTSLRPFRDTLILEHKEQNVKDLFSDLSGHRHSRSLVKWKRYISSGRTEMRHLRRFPADDIDAVSTKMHTARLKSSYLAEGLIPTV